MQGYRATRRGITQGTQGPSRRARSPNSEVYTVDRASRLESFPFSRTTFVEASAAQKRPPRSEDPMPRRAAEGPACCRRWSGAGRQPPAHRGRALQQWRRRQLHDHACGGVCSEEEVSAHGVKLMRVGWQRSTASGRWAWCFARLRAPSQRAGDAGDGSGVLCLPRPTSKKTRCVSCAWCC